MENNAPIVLFGYNRPKHTQKCLESLSNCDLANQSTLFIYTDASKAPEDFEKVQKVRKIIRSKKWTKEANIIERKENYGLAKNIIEGVSEVINEYGKVIVLEDDLVVSKGFLKYMNEALSLYENEEKVMNINAYMYPLGIDLPETFFYNVISSWGWATWARAWKHFSPDTQELWDKLRENDKIHHFDLNGSNTFRNHLERNLGGELNTWAIKWYASVYLQQGFCLNPRQALVRNIGFDDSGTNTNDTRHYDIPELAKKIEVKPIPLQELKGIRKKMKAFYKYGGLKCKDILKYFLGKYKGYFYRNSPKLLKSIYSKVRD